jgi:hypothetical protein
MSVCCSCISYGYFSTDRLVQLQAGRSGDRNLLGANFSGSEAHPVPCKMGSLYPSSG